MTTPDLSTPPDVASSPTKQWTPSDHLTTEEAAAWLDLSPRTLEKLRVIGGGPKFRKLRRRVKYVFRDLQDWSDQRACDSTSDANYLNSR